MRRAYLLVIVVMILLFSALTIGLGWYLFIPQKISQIVSFDKADTIFEDLVPDQPQIVNDTVNEQKAVRLKIGEKAAYRKEGYAEVEVALINVDDFEGSAKIIAYLYYARKQVANNTLIVENIAPGETVIKQIVVETQKDWNAFDVRQI